MTAAVIALSISQVATDSGTAVGASHLSARHAVTELDAAVTAEQRSSVRPCSARRAVRFYAAKIREHAARMGRDAPIRSVDRRGCPRHRARLLQRKAYAWRLRAERWWARTPKLTGETWRDVRLSSTVNANLWRIAVCETGGINGGRPLWTHHNSVYSGALGFAHSTWAHWRHFVRPLPPRVAAQASPAEQLAVGRALVRTFGGYSSWPACHRRLGLG